MWEQLKQELPYLGEEIEKEALVSGHDLYPLRINAG